MITAAILVWILSSFMVAWFEFDIFWNLPLLLFTMNLSVFDQTLIVWTLLARTLIVTTPAVLVISASHWSGRFAALRRTAWACHLFILTWLIVDVGLQSVTGATLWYYASKAMMTEDMAVSGDISAVTEGIKSSLLIVGGGILLLFVGCGCVMRIWLMSAYRAQLPRAMKVVSALAVVIVLGIFAAREFAGNPFCLEQLHGSMAFRTWLFHPNRISNYSDAAFGRPCDSEFSDLTLHTSRLCQAPPIPQTDSQCAAIDSLPELSQRPNVVILFTESLRHDVLTSERFPLVSRWAKQSLVAEQHFSCSNCSELGAFACLYSRFPMSYADTLDRCVPSESLSVWRELGYERMSISSCSPNFCRMNEFIGPLNFDQEMNFVQRGRPWDENDHLTLSEVADRLQTRSSPLFIFSHLMASHYSYYYPPEYDASPPKSVPALPENPGTVDLLRDRYFKSLAFLDSEFDRFLTSIADTNTVVVITGDHGEEFLDDGLLCHGTRLSDIQTRTPLMIYGPDVRPQRLTVSSSHVDIMPTLLDIVGAGENVLALSHGQSLLRVRENRPLLLAHAPTGEWQCLLVHEEGRLGLTIPSHPGDIRVSGFYDVRGRVDLTQQKNATEIPVWKQRLQKVICREPDSRQNR